MRTENLVVGAGIFGVAVSLALNSASRECVLVDMEADILEGASANNQNRLHTGLHYPRDIETALQCSRGFQRFADEYGPAINGDFRNFYFLGREKTKTSLEGFEQFAEQIGVRLVPMTDEDFDECGINPALIQGGWSLDERVIDINVLRALMSTALAQSDVHLRLGTEISDLTYKQDLALWRVHTREGLSFEARNVFLCTYGSSIPIRNIKFNLEQLTYQVTVVPIVKAQRKLFGATVMDGDFVTLLPRGFSREFLLYGPEPSVAFKAETHEEARRFIDENIEEIEASRLRVLSRTKSFFPSLFYLDGGESLVTVRAIPPNAEGSDQRRSHVKKVGPGLFQIISGKVDYAPHIGDRVLSLLSSEAESRSPIWVV